jgi:Tfp pilus assembly protein PilF
VTAFKQATQVNEAYTSAHFNLATSYQHLNYLEKAKASYEKVINLDSAHT